ncbi:TRAP transporter large permease [Pseudomonas sp. XS1P51]
MSMIIVVTLLAMAVLLSMGVWVGVALAGVGIFSLEIFRHMPVDKLLAQTVSNVSMSPELVALPLFILMGEILFRTKLSKLLFDGLSPWTRHIPGRLLHTNVLGCTLFAAISGSSAATTATVGRITFKELTSRGYDPRIAAGSLAGAGTLGFLIPPSTLMIVYGVLAQVSVLKMFMAGIIPGLLLALAFMTYVAVYALLNPDRLPRDDTRTTVGELLRGLLQLGPVVMLIGFVVGSMMFGFATPTEAAAMGVLGALVICVLQRCFSWRGMWEALMGAMQTSSMIGLIIIGAVFLSVAMGFLKVPATIAQTIGDLGLSPFALIMLLIVFYVILGAVLEGMSIIVMSLPITLPLITAAGYDPIWFGVFLILVVEMAQVTPPVGFNLFVLNGLSGMPLSTLARAALPFFFILVAFTVLITVFPEIVLYLPRTLEH